MHLACRGPGRARAPHARASRRDAGACTCHSQACALRLVVEAAAACRVRGPRKDECEQIGLSPSAEPRQSVYILGLIQLSSYYH
jgi:hypothetical protein